MNHLIKSGVIVLAGLVTIACSTQTGTGSTNAKSSPANTVSRVLPDLVFVNARVYTAHDKPPMENGTVIVTNGKITSVRTTMPGDLRLPAQRVINANGRALSAGLWNAHVHFTSPELVNNPQSVLRNMLLRYGFTHVVDTGSTLENTLKLKDAIASGSLKGPKIVLANGSFVHTGGTPSYLPGITLPEVDEPTAAAPMVNAVLDGGANGIKIFSGSFITPTQTILLPAKIIRAVTDAAHKRDAFVMAHPTNIKGLANAVNGNVDVIAHTTAPDSEVPPTLLQQMKTQGTAIIPTLKLWRYEMKKFGQSDLQADFMENAAVTQLKEMHRAGIPILFGTDVGYMEDFNPAAEYLLMRRAGMNWASIYAALTHEPTLRFGKFANRASVRVEAGASADLVLYEGDPGSDIETLANVAFTIIDGAIVYARNEG